MPKAILAIRHYPTTVILAILLFLATLVITTGSLGKVGTGGSGGDEDGGSGIGGTGRSGEFGGSGFGGTGGPSPFFTSTEPQQEEPASQLPQQVPQTDLIVPSLTPEVVPGNTPQLAESAPVIEQPRTVLEQAIVESVEEHSLQQQSQQIVAGALASTSEDESEISDEAISPELPAGEPVQLVEAPIFETQAPVVREETIPAQNAVVQPAVVLAVEEEAPGEADIVETEAVMERQTETLPVNLEMAVEAVEEVEADRPDRIQRPELPPFQRIRPVDRVSITAPTARPMRI